MISLANVDVDLGTQRVFESVAASPDQRRNAAVGANGSGKSAFARFLNGLVTANSGRVTVHGLDTAREGKALRRRVGFVFRIPDRAA